MTPQQPFDLLIFDLDGTLAETRGGIATSLNFALSEFDRGPLPLETVVRYVGDGARVLVERALGHDGAEFEPADVDRGLASFVGHYSQDGFEDSELYPGVLDTLKELSRDHKFAVLTNKPESATGRVLEVLGISDLFVAAIGGDGDWPRKPDPTALRKIATDAAAPLDRTLMVGDTHVDIRTARAASCQVAGVLFGFRPGDFVEDPPDWSLDSFADLIELCRPSA